MRALILLLCTGMFFFAACSSDTSNPNPNPNPTDTTKNEPKPIEIPASPSFTGKLNGIAQTWVRSTFEDSITYKRCRIYTIDFKKIITLKVENNLPAGKYTTNSLEKRVTVEYFRLDANNEGVTFLTNGGQIEITQNDADNFKGRLNFSAIYLFGPGGSANPEEIRFTDGAFFFKR